MYQLNLLKNQLNLTAKLIAILILSCEIVKCDYYAMNLDSSLSYDLKSLISNQLNESSKLKQSSNENWSLNQPDEQSEQLNEQLNESEQLDQLDLSDQLEQLNNLNRIDKLNLIDETEELDQNSNLNKEDEKSNRIGKLANQPYQADRPSFLDEPKQIRNVQKIPIGKQNSDLLFQIYPVDFI